MVAHAASVSIAQIADDWSAQTGVLVAAALATALFAQAFARLRRRGRPDLAPWTRVLLFGAGLAAGVLPLVSPLDAAGDHYLLSAHMLQHVLLGDLSALLLVLAVRGPLALFLLPPPVLRRTHALRPAVAFLLRPAVSLGLWGVAILAWHIPAAYNAAIANGAVHALEHTCFVIGGTLVWIQLLDPTRRARLTRGQRIAFAFGVLAVTQPIVAVFVLARSGLYHPYAAQPHRLFGLSVLTDQRLAAVVMMIEQLLTVGIYILLQLWPLLRRPRAATLAAQWPA